MFSLFFVVLCAFRGEQESAFIREICAYFVFLLFTFSVTSVASVAQKIDSRGIGIFDIVLRSQAPIQNRVIRVIRGYFCLCPAYFLPVRDSPEHYNKIRVSPIPLRQRCVIIGKVGWAHLGRT